MSTRSQLGKQETKLLTRQFITELTNAQYIKLVQSINPSRPMYVGLDPDARKEAVSLAKRLSIHYKNVYICLLPEGKDVNNIRGKWKDYPIVKYDDCSGIKLLLGGINHDMPTL